ncbi:hypothetical protein [Ferrimonas senticii]|uniref:hypothetical protein n=1 Tax=Ferrimonas senticii TaxID=394566 RepID=UPI0004101ECA|nr:hypothetical protein [Ferrimonas senticii]
MEWSVVVALLVVATSLSLLFIGVLWSALIAFGHRHYLFGVGSLICFPIALWYCIKYRAHSGEALRFLLPGVVLCSLCAVAGYLVFQNVSFS